MPPSIIQPANTVNETSGETSMESIPWDRVIRLLESGANTDQVDPDGQTLLHFAGKMGRRDMLEQLIEAGADCTIADSNGQRPLDVAVQAGQVRLMRDKQADRIALQLESVDYLMSQGPTESAQLSTSNVCTMKTEVLLCLLDLILTALCLVCAR